MASLAAYNGAVLNGQFAEFDEAVTTHQASASAVMYQYEEACDPVAEPWDQPLPPAICGGGALKAEQDAKAADERDSGWSSEGGGGAGLAPPPLAPFRAAEVRSTSAEKTSQKIVSTTGASRLRSGRAPGTVRWPGSGAVRVLVSTNHLWLQHSTVAASRAQACPRPIRHGCRRPNRAMHRSWCPT